MVDQTRQGRGYGRRWGRFSRSCPAFGDVWGVLVSYWSGNAVARRLYASLGFRERSCEGGEVTAALDFAGQLAARNRQRADCALGTQFRFETFWLTG